MSSREVQLLTSSLSSSLTLPASEQSVATPPQTKVEQNHDSLRVKRFFRIQIASRLMIEHPIMIGLSWSWIAPVPRLYKSSRTWNPNFTHITIVRSFIFHMSVHWSTASKNCTKTTRLSVIVVTPGVVGLGSASLSTLNEFGLRLSVLRIRPSLRLSVTYMSSTTWVMPRWSFKPSRTWLTSIGIYRRIMIRLLRFSWIRSMIRGSTRL